MYEKQFQFRSRPFCCIPAAEYYFPASSIDSALESIKLCIDRASGPAILFGHSGWGKSQLLAVLQRDYRQTYRVVNIMACTRMSRRHDLLQNILFELGQPYRDMSEGELRLALIDYLKPSAQCPNGVLLLVDDGHTLPYRLLDELRMITNFVRDGQPRVRLVIAGTQTFEEKLTHPQLESLNQRIAARCYLQALRRDEVEPYIRHQVARAGCTNDTIFQSSAIAAITQLCEGNPRTINQICDHALILAASCGQNSVEGETIAEAFSDIQRLPAHMWIPGLEAKPSTETPASDGSWQVVEFGQIGDEPAPAATIAESPEETAVDPPAEIATVESISESIDAFSSMVDSMANLYAESLEDDPSTEELTSPEPPSTEVQAPMAADPFAEPFAEEFSIHDNYAQLAARQNQAAAQLSEQDVASLSHAFVENEDDIDLSGMNVIEYPLVDHETYQTRQEDGVEITAHTETLADLGDDRDMLMVSQMQAAKTSEERTLPRELTGVSVSRGKAVRLEYGRLFKQLRGAESPQQPPPRK